MYGLRGDVDLNFLVGRIVEQVALGAYEVIFSFDENVKITVYQTFRYFDGHLATRSELCVAGRSYGSSAGLFSRGY